MQLHKEPDFHELGEQVPNATASIAQIGNRMKFFHIEAKMQDDMAAAFAAILDLIKIAFLIEPIIFFSTLKKLESRRKEIEVLFTFVAQIDVLMSIASLRAGLNQYCLPTITNTPKAILAKNIVHPLIINCVPNTIEIDQKSILLTGSNMSGKTAFIRTIGINVLTALTLNTCFAESFSLPSLHIYSAIRISDDLLNDKSYYFEEVLTVREMITAAEGGQACLFLLDEIFKGTNTTERIAAGKAVLSSLAKHDNLVLVSTHDIELADLLKSEYSLYHFSEQVDNKSVDFDYKLKSGKLQHRNAIRILEINEYPKAIIDEANDIARMIDSN